MFPLAQLKLDADSGRSWTPIPNESGRRNVSAGRPFDLMVGRIVLMESTARPSFNIL